MMITKLEDTVLDQIKKCAEAYGGTAWANCITDHGDIHGNQLSGSISSLARKGAIYCWGKDLEATIEVADRHGETIRVKDEDATRYFRLRSGRYDVESDLDPVGAIVAGDQCDDCGSPPKPEDKNEFYQFVVGTFGVRCENPDCRAVYPWD